MNLESGTALYVGWQRLIVPTRVVTMRPQKQLIIPDMLAVSKQTFGTF